MSKLMEKLRQEQLGNSPRGISVQALGKNEAEIRIDGEIGFWGITARQFIRELKEIDASTIHVRINSPGGDVWQGTAMYNALKNHKAQIIVHIDAIALSMGSVIAMAGDHIYMAANSFMMIHDPWMLSMGTGEDLRKAADVLDKHRDVLAKTYADRAGGDVKEFLKLMKAETWFTAEEAKEAGLVDAIEPNKTGKKEQAKALAGFDLAAFARVPKSLKKLLKPSTKNKSFLRLAASASRPPAELRAATLANGRDKGQASNTKQETDKDLEQFKAFAAANSDALKDVASKLISDAKTAGATEANTAAIDRAKALKSMKGATAEFALDQFIAGNDVAKAHGALSDKLASELEELKKNPASKQQQNSGRGPIPSGGQAGNQDTVNPLLADADRRAAAAAKR